MVTYKNKGLIYAQYVLDAINEYYLDTDGLVMRVETFYNCREQGYVLGIYDEEKWNSKAVVLWVYAQRNSDKPTLTYEKNYAPQDSINMYTDEDYTKRTETFNTIEELVEKAIKVIEEIVLNE